MWIGDELIPKKNYVHAHILAKFFNELTGPYAQWGYVKEDDNQLTIKSGPIKHARMIPPIIAENFEPYSSQKHFYKLQISKKNEIIISNVEEEALIQLTCRTKPEDERLRLIRKFKKAVKEPSSYIGR